MDVVNCQVRLSGDQFYTISKKGVTVAEIQVLRHIHGNDAVINISKTGDTRKPKTAIREYIEMHYGERVPSVLWGEDNQTGGTGIPIKLADIGILPDSPFIDPTRRAKSKGAPVEEPYEDDEPEAVTGDEPEATTEKPTSKQVTPKRATTN